MLRSLYSGVSGLRNHQVKMDVIGNNIANVNTYGFKYGRALFQDVFSQNVRGASGPGEVLGGRNPSQVGLGISVAAIDTVHTQGGVATTEKPLDFMIDGEGFFVVREGTNFYYTRSGNFYQDSTGDLLDANGRHLQGFIGPFIDSTGTAVDFNGKLDAKGVDVAEYFEGGDVPVSNLVGDGTSDPAGALIADWYDAFVHTSDGSPYPEDGLMNLRIPPCFTDIRVSQDGTISAKFDGDGEIYKIGMVMISKFVNPEGLEKVGGNNYMQTLNSGAPEYNRPTATGFGKMESGALEMSNVDLARETTEMIVTQRGFQANSRIITVSDSLLEELVNLKR